MVRQGLFNELPGYATIVVNKEYPLDVDLRASSRREARKRQFGSVPELSKLANRK